MRKIALWNASHVRLSLVMLLALVSVVAVYGCGGGGGSSTPTTGGTTGVPQGNPTLATVTGTVVDTSSAAGPVIGAVVSIKGTNLSAKTGNDGKFAIVNVPVGTVGVVVQTPDPNAYYSLVQFGPLGATKVYDTSLCPITLTTKASSGGTSPLPYNPALFPANSPPPPPTYDPNTGCPK